MDGMGMETNSVGLLLTTQCIKKSFEKDHDEYLEPLPFKLVDEGGEKEHLPPKGIQQTWNSTV